MNLYITECVLENIRTLPLQTEHQGVGQPEIATVSIAKRYPRISEILIRCVYTSRRRLPLTFSITRTIGGTLRQLPTGYRYLTIMGGCGRGQAGVWA